MTKTIIDMLKEQDQERRFLAPLAEAYGINAAVLIDRCWFWMKVAAAEKGGRVVDGVPWFWKTVDEFREEMPWLGRTAIKETIYALEKAGVLLSRTDLNEVRTRTKWYSINIQAMVDRPDSGHPIGAKATIPNGQKPAIPNGQKPAIPNGQKPAIPDGQNPAILPYTSSSSIPDSTSGPCGPAETAAEKTGGQSHAGQPDAGEDPAGEGGPAWKPKDGAKAKQEGAVQASVKEVLAGLQPKPQVDWSAKAFTDKRTRKDLMGPSSGVYVEAFWREGMVHLKPGAHALNLPLPLKHRKMLLYVVRRLYDPEIEKPRHALARLEIIMREWGEFIQWLINWHGVKNPPSIPEIKFLAGADMANRIWLYCDKQKVAESKADEPAKKNKPKWIKKADEPVKKSKTKWIKKHDESWEGA